jgi:hypothetical protein
MSSHEERFTPDHWEELLKSIDLEVAQLAIVCGVPLLKPGIAERVLENDPLVCHSSNTAALSKLRNLLMMHFAVSAQMGGELGADAAAAIAVHVREKLAPRVGHQLDGDDSPSA